MEVPCDTLSYSTSTRKIRNAKLKMAGTVNSVPKKLIITNKILPPSPKVVPSHKSTKNKLAIEVTAIAINSPNVPMSPRIKYQL